MLEEARRTQLGISWCSAMMGEQRLLTPTLWGGQQVREGFLDLENEQVLEGGYKSLVVGRAQIKA